jgi:methyltransferase (TIGR00027 family)
MDPGRASATAIGTALMRAAHTRLDRPALIEDPWGDRLILAEEREGLLALSGAADLDAALRAHPSYGTVILRARYTEDALADAVRRGVRQYVIVGAGMDSFALRRPAFARDVEVFEVDHPATQEFKASRLASCDVTTPPGLHMVAVDLSETGLDTALAGCSFRHDEPAFFSWLGVSSYLTRDANLTTLAAIAASTSAGGELVFSYLHRDLLDAGEQSGAMQSARAQVASVGEPWLSGFDPEELRSDLRGTGLELIENLGPEELQARYCADRRDGLCASPGSHLARARLSAR